MSKATLTKSLHTVTAVTCVAAHLLDGTRRYPNPHALATSALLILGYDVDTFAKTDDTVARCVAACAKLMGVRS